MLNLLRLTMEDFGPFKDRQDILFPPDGGVSLIYGENMRGKTTLLNAFRYALFGKVIMRGDQQMALHLISNWEKAAEGHYGFKVILEFDHASKHYVLTRECKLRDGITVPSSDTDYIQMFYLLQDGNVLGPHEAVVELARIMPEKVSRFFLFDGELLQQYEELLRHESTMGYQIKEAIERILGVPVLINTRSHLAELYQDAQRKESGAAQRNQKTQELGTHLATQIALREAHEKEITRLNGDLEKLKVQKLSKEEQIRKTQKLRALLNERDQLQAEVADITAKIAEKEEHRREIMGDAWRWILLPRIHSLRTSLEEELANIKTRQTRKAVSGELVEKISEGLKTGQCSTCEQILSPEARTRLEGVLASLKNSAAGDDLSAQIQSLVLRIQTFRQSEAESKSDLVKEINDTIDDLVVSRATKGDRIREIGQQTKDLDETEARKLSSDYDTVVREITIMEQGIESEKDAREECNKNIHNIQAKLSKIAGVDLKQERKCREMYGRLHDLFNQGVAAYRDRLRDKVEKDATDLFLKLTSEPDYKGLKINENYGLTIVHKDGKEIPVRSAGAEHIVALSLMGALQSNAPLQGPIIMDSPFGRLDQTHTTKVIKALPTMAYQLILLAYESELEPKTARTILLGNLKMEYRIARKSARYSLIEKYVGV